MSSARPTPDLETILAALDVACRAPSVHNTQPWRWAIAEHSVHLFADASRRLPVVDPDGREMTISCGAALHHARVAFRALGWQPRVHRLPNPADRDHLAAIEFTPLPQVDQQTLAMVSASAARRTDRRPFLNAPVPAELLEQVASAAVEDNVRVTIVTDPVRRRQMILALAHADVAQRADSLYQDELLEWTHRHTHSHQGILAGSVAASGPLPHGIPGRDFGTGDLESPPAVADGATLCVLSTSTDEPLDWLRTGEALSAVLLAATTAELGSCALSQVTETRVTRDLARLVTPNGIGEPQVAVRIGWPATAEFPGPTTPRRPLADVARQWTD
jgi:nitroreductase